MPQSEPTRARRVLITGGPTHEPIDAVRYLANRSSGRLAVALAQAAARRGHAVTLLLGPVPLSTSDSHLTLLRFRTTADLQGLLEAEFPKCDLLIMAAAVADYRPKSPADPEEKRRRTGEDLVLHLEPTPDLLAMCGQQRRPDQRLIGFALEPAGRLQETARRKLLQKRVDLVVANPLQTMDSQDIHATLIRANEDEAISLPPMTKAAFADRLIDEGERLFSIHGPKQ